MAMGGIYDRHRNIERRQRNVASLGGQCSITPQSRVRSHEHRVSAIRGDVRGSERRKASLLL